MKEISRREKEAGIIPKPDIDTFMKAISVEGLKKTLQTEYILKILGLEVCADTIVGNAMKRGISGGQKKRLTTGCVDCISTLKICHLIVACLKHLAYITASTVLISLLQPAPETFDLFDDIILMAEGKIVYHGPRSNVLEFFEHCGLRCPPRKGVADFLQEVVFEKDQAQYWFHKHVPHSYMKIDFSHADYYMTSLFYALVRHLCNGVEELSLTSSRLPVFYKQRDFCFYPAWTDSIPAIILKVPFSLTDAFVWTAITYYAIGYSPEPESPKSSVAAICALSSFLVMLLFGGFLLPQSSLPAWLGLGLWFSPFAYAEIAVSVNEFLSPRWQKVKLLLLINRAEHCLDSGSFLYFGFICALTYLKSPGRSRAIISHDKLCYLTGTDNLSNTTKGKEFPFVITIEALNINIENVQYFVDTPKKLRDQGFPLKKLQLLSDITGAFRPGILTALMWSRENGTDWWYYRRGDKSLWEFVAEVLQLIELDEIKDSLVGIPGTSGISNEQRKRLTIAVELVSNPSIIFMDEPTSGSGLDARAAAVVVMRVVKNIVHTKRTVVCTIHQPSIDIFEAFDESIMTGSQGHFWVPKIKHNYNPATWMLEVTSPAAEAQLGLDFALLYKESHLFRDGGQDLLTILASAFILMLVIGGSNCSSVIPFIATERTVIYRKMFAGMYSSWVYSIAQVIIEIPYVFLQPVLFPAITYPAINFYWSFYKVFWYFYTLFCTLLFFSYFGMLLASVTPTYQVATVSATFSYTMFNLFSGYLIPGPVRTLIFSSSTLC
ncbi:hypothetical protein Pint_17175 [Pistacia integerrima]|uniref:Uncharacterized protein n=1 Tax=Pistacia integerrima TaxID=434235 RepID=A0ACC0YYN7_9ROSI|nr:hypothetical protein Pint_17175 [Pistacia integerrima]